MEILVEGWTFDENLSWNDLQKLVYYCDESTSVRLVYFNNDLHIMSSKQYYDLGNLIADHGFRYNYKEFSQLGSVVFSSLLRNRA
jgi:hypothetical protein